MNVKIFISPASLTCRDLEARIEAAGLEPKVEYLDVTNPEHRMQALDRGIQQVPIIICDDYQITVEELFAKLS